MTHYPLIQAAAKKHGLDARLVSALVLVESGGNQWAFRPEVAYPYLWDCRGKKPFRVDHALASSKTPPPNFTAFTANPQQEWTQQQASIGLCQVMGAVARELGFTGPFLLELTDPQLNLDLGCRLLAQRLTWAQGNVAKALGAYNAGPGNATGAVGQAYAWKVIAQRDAMKVQP